MGTAGAVKKPDAINQEASEFAHANGTARIIGISFDRGGAPTDWSSASWHEFVENKHRKSEDPAALKTGEPSAEIVKHIVAACDYMKSKDRVRLEREQARAQRKRIINSSLLIVALLLAIGAAASVFAFFEFRQAAVARAEARNARAQADVEISESRAAAAAAAEQARRDIEKSQRDAELAIANANSLTKDANDRRIAAENAARKAETSLMMANTEIDRQRNLAKALSLANHAESIRDESPHQLGPSVLFAAESMRRARTFAADQALRRGLALIPKSLVLKSNVQHAYNSLNESATFSPNGRYVLTMTNNQVVVWDALSGAPNRVTQVTHQKLYSFCFSPNGEYLVTGGGQQVNVWSSWWTSAPKLEASLIHSHEVRDVIVSPKNKYLATSDAKHVVHVWENWNSSRAREVASTSGVTRPSAPVRVVFSDDESRFAAQLNHRSVGVFSSTSGLMIGEGVTGHLIANRKFLVSVTDNNELQVSTPTGDRVVGRVRGFDAEKLIRNNAYGLMDYSDVTHVLALESDHGTLVINVVDNHVVTQLDYTNDIVDTISLSPDGNLLAVTNYRSRITKIWRIAENTRREELRLDPQELAIQAVFSPDGQRIATIGSNSVRIWTTNVDKQDRTFDVEGDVTAIAVSPDERYVAASVASRVFIIDAVTGKIAPPFDVGERVGAHIDSVLTFSKNGEYLAFTYANRTFIFADWQSAPRQIGVLRSSDSQRSSFSPDAEYIAISNAKTVAIWNRKDWNEESGSGPKELPHDDTVQEVVFDNDGRFLVTVTRSAKIQLWEGWKSDHPHVVSAFVINPLSNGSKEMVSAIALSPDNHRLAVATYNGIYCWDDWSDDLRRREKPKMRGILITRMQFSSDSRYLAGTNYRSGSIWDTTSGSEVTRVKSDGLIAGVAFLGNHLITAGDFEKPKLWLWRPEDLISKACEYINSMGTTIAPHEWRLYIDEESTPQTCSPGWRRLKN